MSESEVVISGIGGWFPESQCVQDFGRDLLENKHLPTPTNRWKYDAAMDVNPVCGQTGFEYFDDVFYGINRRLATSTDPVSKMGYLRSFEAIVDAGLHPYHMRGAKVAVYAGTGISEFEQMTLSSGFATRTEGYLVMGMSKTMFPNRISYYFDFTGPSCAMDSSWASMHLQMELASKAIRDGSVDGALIVSANINRFPNAAFQLKNLGLISKDSVTRSFDQDASGSVPSDCSVAFFLQRADQAKRCYATVLATGLKFTGQASTLDPTLPDPRGIRDFLQSLYTSHDVDPRRIAYMEADGSGHPIRDESELCAIDAALVEGSGRKGALLVGSVKSNIGHTDSVCAMVGVCKAVVAMETGVIPATINYRRPNPRIPGLVDGRLRVVDSNTPLQLAADSVVAVNTLGVCNMVGHTVLGPNRRGPRTPQRPEEHLPRLITLSGRTEEGVRELAKKVQSMPFDTTYYRMVQDVFSTNIRGYDYRTYVICPSEEVPPVERMEKRAVWFAYSGMGSQWAGMGAGLMCLPVFAETIERLHAVLAPKGVDLKTVISETGPDAFDNILKSFVGITACQVALTNVLNAVGVVPDFIVGHSVGELGCAYADGCLTEEQTILAAYARGVASNQAPLIKGMMAAIGLGHKDVRPRLPPSIDVACHNSATSCTLSGPAEDVQKFVKQLSDEGVFARAVNVSDIAYHSRYIQPAAPFLREQLERVIPNPKQRSQKWVSTSVPQDQLGSDLAKYCSAAYQTNNLLSPVLFEEALTLIPQQAVVVEVAPHGLLQAILKRALPECMHVALTQRDHVDPLRVLLSGIGKTAAASCEPIVAKLYPDVEWPAPRGTGSLASLVTWQLDESNKVDTFQHIVDKTVPVLPMDGDSPYMMVNGIRLAPLSELMVLMWKCLSRKLTQPVGSFRAAFRNIRVDRWHKIPTEGASTVWADMMAGTALVEIAEQDSDTLVARGYALELTDNDEPPPNLPALSAADLQQAITVSKAEVYRAMELLGLRYASKYQCIHSVQMGDCDWQATVRFNGDFSCLFESVLQIYTMKGTEGAHAGRLPKTLQRLDIDPAKLNGISEIKLRLNLASGVMEGDGLYAFGVTTEQCPAELYYDSTPTALQFVPFGETKFQTVNEFLRVVVDGVLETSGRQKAGGKTELTLMELPNGPKTTDISNALVAAIRAATGVQSRVVKLTPAGTDPPGCKGPVPLLVTGPDTMMEAVCSLAVGLTDSLLAWSGERLSGPPSAAAGSKLAVLAEQRMGDEWLSLLRRARPVSDADAVVVQLQPAMLPPPVVLSATATVVLVWRGIDEVAMQTAIAEAETRPYADRTRLVFILDDTAPPFSLSTALYGDQLARGARVNVLVRGGVWGCWRSLPVPKPLSPALSASSLGDVKLEFVGPNPLDEGSLSGHVDYVGVEAGGRRVFGVGQWLTDSCPPRPDPLLRWPVPRGWSAPDAATVPYVYSAVYYALKLKAEARRGESILVHEGASAIGQAAIRVASQLGCSPIYTTVRDAKQRELVRRLFPQLEPSHVFACGDGGSFEYRLRLLTRGGGVRLVVNTLADSELRASLRCLSHWGRMLHFKREDMVAARTIGTQLFLNSITLYGFSGSELFRGSERERAAVAEAMLRGLEDGTVQPIAGVSVYDAQSGVDQREPSTKAVIKVDSSSPSANQQCDPHKCYLVVGFQAADALAVASRLSTLGARQVLAAVGSSSGAAAVRQQQRVLRRQHGTHLHVQQVRAWSPAAAQELVKAAASVAPLHTAVVIVKDDVDAETSALLCDALPDVGLVLLAERAESACQLAALSSRRHGRRTACMAAAITDALDHLAELLSGTSSSAVTVLPSATSTTQGLVDPGRWLPQTPAALSEVSQGATRCGRGPQLLELPTLARPSRTLGESQPLFVLPPLGVLDAAAKKEIAGLAARLFSPVLVVEASLQAGVESTARAVVKAIRGRVPWGPYNVLGWHLGAVLALEVQRQLEAAGKRGTLFLVQSDVVAVTQWARAFQGGQAVANKAQTDAHAQRGTLVVAGLVDAVANHQSDVISPFTWAVHVVRSSAEDQQSLNENDPNVRLRVCADPGLDSAALALYLNENFATSQTAGEDLRTAISSRRAIV